MVAHSSNIRLSGLSIRFAGRTEAANGLYANGRHQCEVVIDVVKETCGPDGEWIATPLTDEERASVTVVEWSEHDTQTLTQGWSCDDLRNEFALGLWRDESAQEHTEEDVEWVEHPEAESISRYLRCDPDAPIGPAMFMARVSIDGDVYTTHCSVHGVVFESSVTLSAVAPLELSAADLDLYMDLFAYTPGNFYRTSVHVYYWTPPKGLHFIKNMGFDDPLGIPGEGKDFQSTFIHQNIPGPEFNKAGTFINKDDPDSLLYLDEIHEGLAAPSPNPLVRFNERPTIMRAIRLKSELVAEARDTKSTWRLLDNYGTEQRFFLAPAGGIELPGFPYLLLKDTLVPPRLRLAHFEITLPNGGVLTKELYANGRHQCKVVVEVSAEQMQSDGSWALVRLTDMQRSSVTIRPYSRNANEPLPSGWRSGAIKNIYDTGLWRPDMEAGVLENPIETKAERSNIQREVLERYMSFDPGYAIEPVAFMASIRVGEITYTTNYSVGDEQFNSRVTITPQRPYVVLARSMSEVVDARAFVEGKCDIDVYYWIPPAGLRILSNRGLDEALEVPGEGLNFQTTFYQGLDAFDFIKAGVVIGKDVLNPIVSVADIHSDYPNGHEKSVRFNYASTIMRAVRFRWKPIAIGAENNHSKWLVWDNYGCEHVFRFDRAEGGNVIRLSDG